MSTLQTAHKSCFLIELMTNTCPATKFLIQFIIDNIATSPQFKPYFYLRQKKKDLNTALFPVLALLWLERDLGFLLLSFNPHDYICKN